MAKTVVKNIIVALRARLGNFKQQMASGEQSVRGFMARAGGIGSGMLKVGGIAAGAAVAAAGALGALTMKSANAMDQTGKLADRLGIGTEALIGLRHAADLAGVTGLDANLEKWNKNLGEAAAGTGEAKDALAKLGLSASELVKLPMQEQLGRVADAMAGVSDPATRAALSADLFGKSGMQMATMLAGGSQSLRDAAAEAEALGMTYSRQTAALAERMNDNMTRLKSAATGVFTSFAAAAMPQIEAAIGGTLAFIQTNAESIKAVLSGAFSALGEVVRIFGAAFSVVFDVVGSILQGFGVSFESTGGGVQAVIDAIIGAVRWLADLWLRYITFLEAAFVNWRETLEIVWKGALLGLVVFGENIRYWFATVIPALLDWFSGNWKDIFTTLWNATKAIFANMYTNVANFFKAVWSWVKGDGFDFEWTGLLEGFESTIKEMPKIAERVKGELETSLATDISAASDKIGEYYSKKLEERRKKLEETRKAAAEAVDAKPSETPKKADSAAPTEAAPSAPTDAAKRTESQRQQDFGVLGRAMSLAALAAAPETGDEKSQRETAANTSAAARTLDNIDRKLSGSGNNNILIFEGA